nr:MAG TPA: hypothetical protein [Caudoviricetes sp.]
MLHNALVICRELVAYRILIIKPCLCHIGIEVDLVYAMLLEYLAEIRVEHVKRGVKLGRLALDTMLTHDLFCLLHRPMSAGCPVLILHAPRPILCGLAVHLPHAAHHLCMAHHAPVPAVQFIAYIRAAVHIHPIITKPNRLHIIVLLIHRVMINRRDVAAWIPASRRKPSVRVPAVSTVIRLHHFGARGETPVVVMFTTATVAEFVLHVIARVILVFYADPTAATAGKHHHLCSARHLLTAPLVAGAGAAPPSMLVRLLLGAQQGLPSIRNEPPVADVETQAEYRVRVRMPQAVTCAQLRLVSGYSVVPVPMVMYTGALIVAVSGIACATTMQYFSQSL